MKKFTLILLWLLIIPGLLMAQWKSVDLGTGETSNKLYAFDNQNAIVVGNDTILIKTTDGGETWSSMNFVLPNEVEYHFMDVDFADDQIGFIISTKVDPYNAIMLKSTDAGENWAELAMSNFSDASGNDVIDPLAGKKVNFRALQVSGDIAYAALQWEEELTTTKHSYVFKSTDKGLNWSISSDDLGSVNVNSIEFIDDVVYIGGSSSMFMKSTDGGANWTDYTDAAFLSVNDLRVIDANKVYLATTKGTFYTENAGVTVTALNDIGSFDVLYFADDEIIFSGFTSSKTVRTIDGGENWIEANIGQTTSFWDLTIFNDAIYALGSGGIINILHPSELKDPVIEFSYLFKGSEAQFTNESENCGSYTWKFNVDTSSVDSISNVVDPIYRFADYDTHTIKLIGGNAVAEDSITHDITVLEPTADFTYYSEDGNNVFFTNTSKNCAEFEWNFGELSGSADELTTSHVFSELGTFTVKLTADNYIEKVTATQEITISSVGAFWSKNQLEIDQILQKMHVFNDDIAIAVGNSSTIIKSVNGGESWSEFDIPAELDGQTINDVMFFDDNNGLNCSSAAGSANGFMLKTTDQGENWTEVPLTAFSDGSSDETLDPVAGLKVYFYAMEQIDENNAFVVLRWQDAESNKYGFIYKTSDKGSAWVKSSNDIFQENDFSSTITDIAFAPSGEIGFVAGNKILLKTEDSGNTWINISNEAFGYITEMLVLNNDTIFACSGNGVFKTTDRFVNVDLTVSGYSWDIISLGADKFMTGRDVNILNVTEDFGESWVNMGKGLSASFFELTIFNGKIFAFSSKGLTSISYIDNYQTPVVDFEYSIEDKIVTFTDKSENIIASNWSFGDTEVSTDLSPVYTYDDYGTYTVTLNGNSRCKKASISKKIELVTTGVDLIDASSIKVYPNPVVNDKLYIDLGNMYDGEISVEIYNTEGRQLISKRYSSSSLIELDIDINKGLYFVKVNNNAGINHTMKLIVQ
ncbi:MAG: PKD domain-containing protein [Bacteroidales bacterium]|nr:PKD domain-containing protein [Bacteroidales bacterium]